MDTTGFVESLIKNSKNNVALRDDTIPDVDYATKKIIKKIADFFGSTRLSVYLMYSFVVPIVFSACFIFVFDYFKVQNDLFYAAQTHFGNHVEIEIPHMVSRNSAVVRAGDEYYLVRFDVEKLVYTRRLTHEEVFALIRQYK